MCNRTRQVLAAAGAAALCGASAVLAPAYAAAGRQSQSTYSIVFTTESINGNFPLSNCTSAENWSVTLNGVTQNCLDSGNGPVNIHFQDGNALPDGSYPFTIDAPAGYTFTPRTGYIVIGGADVTQYVAWISAPGQSPWTESVIPGQANGFRDESLACGGAYCYERGVVQTGPSSYGNALWTSTDAGATWPTAPYVPSSPGINLADCDDAGNEGTAPCLVTFGQTAYALAPASTSCCQAAFWETTGASGTWTSVSTVPSGSATPSNLACADVMDCYVLANGQFLSIENAGQQWASRPVSAPSNNDQMACPAVGFCVIASDNGDIVTTDSGVTWNTFGPAGATDTISCPTSDVCWTTVGSQLWMTADASAATTAKWTAEQTVNGTVTQIACQNQASCLAIDRGGPVVYVVTGGAVATESPPNSADVLSVAVSSAGYLIGADSNGVVAAWTNPAPWALPTTTAITSATPVSPVVGEPITVDTQVQDTATGTNLPAPAGPVTVSDGASHTCAGSLSGSSGLATASCAITESTPGTYSFTASYPGDANDAASSTAASTSVSVGMATSATQITSITPNPVYGQPITVNAQVTGQYTGQGAPAPQGTVTISDGAGQTCPAGLSGSNGVATGACQITEHTLGPFSFAASYPGSAAFSSSQSSPSPVTVGRAPTTTNLTLSATKATYGHEQRLLLTVNVATPYSVIQGGNVRITTGKTAICVITLSGGFGTCSPASGTLLGASQHALVASFPGAADYARSKATKKLTVTRATTTTKLRLSASRITYGHEKLLKFTVTVAPQYSGTVTGTVTIAAGVTVCRIKLKAGKGTCSPPSNTTLLPGRYTALASYAGNSNFKKSLGTSTLTIAR